MSAKKVVKEVELPVRLYLPLVGGAPIIAEVVNAEQRDGTPLAVRNAAHVHLAQEQTHYIFSPLPFFQKQALLYPSGLIAESIPPEHILSDYKQWLKTRPN